MGLTTVEMVILIILVVFLALALILSVATLVLIIKLVKSVKRIVAKAEDVVDSVEVATDVLKNVSGPLATLRVLKNIVSIVQNGQKKK
ncbi:hypothetical protein H7171_01460 [Candidatus Saccharibacteria bacterium]|nr:hypothetical protein [Candidatus Saccharibacteria bacterium]